MRVLDYLWSLDLFSTWACVFRGTAKTIDWALVTMILVLTVRWHLAPLGLGHIAAWLARVIEPDGRVLGDGRLEAGFKNWSPFNVLLNSCSFQIFGFSKSLSLFFVFNTHSYRDCHLPPPTVQGIVNASTSSCFTFLILSTVLINVGVFFVFW